jgi:hypothetical protein
MVESLFKVVRPEATHPELVQGLRLPGAVADLLCHLPHTAVGFYGRLERTQQEMRSTLARVECDEGRRLHRRIRLLTHGQGPVVISQRFRLA